METLKYIHTSFNKTVFHFFCITAILFTSCKKYITVDTPSTSIGTVAAFQTNTSAAQVLTGIYAEMANNIANGSLVSTSILPELSADNLTLHDPNSSRQYVDYYKNSLESNYITTNQSDTYWTKIYGLLFTVNTAIEQLTGNQELSPNVAKRLLGEAHFMRAFLYFYLVNFYRDVPLVLSTNYHQNATLRKSISAEVYNQILNDLSTAESLLDYTYMKGDISGTTPDRLRPNLTTVNALQARVHLYQKNYAAAEAAANKVITQSGYGLASLDAVFLKNSTETIWGLQPVSMGFNTLLANLFLIPSSGPSGSYPMYASKSLIESFQLGDARKDKWLGLVTTAGKDYRFPTKYKRGFISNSKEIVEYTIVFRVAEVYLIRAEARNEQGNSKGSVEDLNAIRERSRSPITVDIPNPLPPLSDSLTQAQLRPIIINERRSELFTEWGHRWFDLRRSETIDAVVTEEEKVKGGSWAPYKIYYPIPQYDLNTNQNLIQTPGYSN